MAVHSTLIDANSKKIKAVRVPYLMLGFSCVALGYVGFIVPGMPSTIFFICAVWAFKRSSPRFENWLLGHPIFGSTLRDWDNHKAITLRTKIIAISTMALFACTSLFFIRNIWIQALVLLTVLAVAFFIATRKTKV